MLARIDHDLTDSGRGSAATERLCALTREVMPVAELIRFVIGPDGSVVPDIKKKLPGRGVWIKADRTSLAEAIRRKTFARSFKRDVRATAELVDLTDRLLERAALEALSIANKAGRVVTGFAKVEAAAAGSPMSALLHASEAGADGVRKLHAAMRRREPGEAEIMVLTLFSGPDLDLALGRSNVVHAALLAGPETQRFIARVARLTRFRSGETANPGLAGTVPCTEP